MEAVALAVGFRTRVHRSVLWTRFGTRVLAYLRYHPPAPWGAGRGSVRPFRVSFLGRTLRLAIVGLGVDGTAMGVHMCICMGRLLLSCACPYVCAQGRSFLSTLYWVGADSLQILWGLDWPWSVEGLKGLLPPIPPFFSGA